MRSVIAGIDIGGTKIAGCLMNSQGELICDNYIETRAYEGRNILLERLLKFINELLKNMNVEAIGVGCPGAIDSKSGEVFFSPNLPWEGVPLKKIIEDEFSLPAVVENDANAAALGEYRYGAGVGTENMVYVTISTGIGCGIIIKEKLYHGADNLAGEFGHITLYPDGPICSCGKKGCLEALGSGLAIERRAGELLEKGVNTRIKDFVSSGGRPDARAVSRAYEAGDEEAKKILKDTGNYIGIGIASLINLFNPERVIIGGGLSKIKGIFWDTILDSAADNTFCEPLNSYEIVRSTLGDQVGLYGAAALVLDD